MTKDAALSAMRAAHDRFWMALGGYAFMTHEPLRRLLAALRITMGRNPPAGRVARRQLESMLMDCFDATTRFTKGAGMLAALKSDR